MVRECCETLDVPFAVSDIYANGGEGGVELARRWSTRRCRGQSFKPLYDWSEPVKDKMEKIAQLMYGARRSLHAGAEKELKQLEDLGYGKLPLSVAKTPTSLTDDPRRSGRPRDFEIVVRDFHRLGRRRLRRAAARRHHADARSGAPRRRPSRWIWSTARSKGFLGG